MPLNSTLKRVPGTLLAITMATLACSLNLGGPQPEGDPIPTSQGSAEELLESWKGSTGVGSATGQITVVFTEVQITSYLADRLSRQTDPLLKDPQVYLREGQVRVYGTSNTGPLEAGVQVIIQPIIDEGGSIQFEILSAEFGPLPAPELLLDSLSTILTEAFTGAIGPLATGIRINSIVIESGSITIVGEIRQ